MPSAFMEDELFEEPYSLEEIKTDPRKYILWSAENNKLEEAETLLREDGDLVHSMDEDGYTPLHRAAYNAHNDMIKLLISNKANIHARTLDGWQPFHSACRWDNVSSARLLIELGADVHAVTNGKNTALHLAAVNGEAESIIKFLLNETDIDSTMINTGGDSAEDICRRNSVFDKHFKQNRNPDKSSHSDKQRSADSCSQGKLNR